MSRSAVDAQATAFESWWEDQRSRLQAESVRPLNDLVRTWRARGSAALIPWFDPDDGGVDAPVLVLTEAPATVRPGGSKFCSEDNSDGTTRTLG